MRTLLTAQVAAVLSCSYTCTGLRAYTHTGPESEQRRERETDRQTDRQRQRQTETDRQTDRAQNFIKWD